MTRRVFHGWWIVAVFAVTQTVGYGTLYYAFAVLLQPIAADLHTGPATVTGAFTIAVLAWAAAAIPVGRWLDRHGGRALMSAGSGAGALLLVAWSRVGAVWQLYLVFAGLGVAMAMALYDAATAVIVTWFDTDRRPKAILAMIVVAGFASTIFMPATGLLEHRYGWRNTLLILAAVYAVVVVPLHAVVVRRRPNPGRPDPPERRHENPVLKPAHTDRQVAAVRTARRDGRFWCLVVAFVAHSAAMSTMTVHLVGFLVHKGHSTTFAATVAGLLGVLSVTGRRLRLTTVVAVVFAVQATAAVLLPLLAATRAGAIAGVTAFGVGFGVASLAAPTLLAGRYGTTGYATIAGTLNTPVTLAKATAPLAAAALAAVAGYTVVLTAIGAACVLAAIGILARADSPAPL